MGKAEIIADLGAGHYTIKRIWAGRDAAQDKIVLINTNIAKLRSLYSTMPESTEDEILAKHIVKLQITSLEKQVQYIQNNFPDDIEIDAYCADYTEELSGEVGTIDIPGEVTELVNILPGHSGMAAFDAERDGEFWPSIAVGPWTSFLNKCILPGWQKWYPKYRYGWIVSGSINYDDNTCAITIQPAFSSQQNLDVNQGDGFGGEIVEEELEVDYFYQPSVAEYPAFQDFCERNPSHPICENAEVGTPVQLTDEQFEQIRQIQYFVNNAFEPESDLSGYGIGEYFAIMYAPGVDTGDCEDYALTKMHLIIEAGILPAKNLQLIFCNVIGEISGGHVVAGIQTTNFGFIILDNRYDELMPKAALGNEYSWEAFQVAGTQIVKVQRLKGEVPIEYMGCNAGAFEDEDEVVVEFTGQDWTQPKVIGFKSGPGSCGVWSMFGGEPVYITAYYYRQLSDTWIVRADGAQHFSGLYFFSVPDDWAAAHGWQLGLVWPVHIRHAPMITKVGGNIFSFGGWFDNIEYFEDEFTSSFAIDTCEKYGVGNGTWSRMNKDQYVGRSCGAGWSINNKSYIAGGAFYDERLNTYYPHIDLEANYTYGDYETPCNNNEEINRAPTPYSNVYYHPGLVWWPEYMTPRFDFDEGVLDRDCFRFSQGGAVGAGAHSAPPSDPGIPYGIMENHRLGGVAYYTWLDAEPVWGKKWYENQLFGECLCFDGETNAYTQRQGTVPTMMVGSFQLAGAGYMVGGTQAEISNLIRSADTDGLTNDVKKFDEQSNAWLAETDFYENRLYSSGFAASGKGYVFSGWSETNHAGSVEQRFGHEGFRLMRSRVHPVSTFYLGGGAFEVFPPGVPDLGMFAGEEVSLFCTNTMHEYDSVARAWTRKNDMATPIGNCRYREFYNAYGSLENPYYYRVDECNRLVIEYFDFEPGGPGNYVELENPGPFDVYDGPQDWRDGESYLHRKNQHIYKYAATGDGVSGFITSLGYMAKFNPKTDSYIVRSVGVKDHLDGGFVS
jgi:predicted transglutaminase-like cysteine proteinase